LSIALVRVDDRLVHGQVLLGWGPALGTRRYLIIDDDLAANEFERSLLESSGGETPVEVLDSTAGAERVIAAQENREPVVVLLRGAPESLALAHAVRARGGRIEAINLGGLHYAPGKERMHDFVYLDAKDRAALAGLLELDVRLFVQDVPGSAPIDVPQEWIRP
jgi:mannose/fructose/N-acetylgalactosamine-specific phosphotransferase system component IIB